MSSVWRFKTSKFPNQCKLGFGKQVKVKHLVLQPFVMLQPSFSCQRIFVFTETLSVTKINVEAIMCSSVLLYFVSIKEKTRFKFPQCSLVYFLLWLPRQIGWQSLHRCCKQRKSVLDKAWEVKSASHLLQNLLKIPCIPLALPEESLIVEQPFRQFNLCKFSHMKTRGWHCFTPDSFKKVWSYVQTLMWKMYT